MKRNLSTFKSVGMAALLVVVAVSLPYAAAGSQPRAKTQASILKAYVVSPVPQTSTVFDALEASWYSANGVARVNASFVSLSEMDVVSFQFLWATDPAGPWQPASDVFPAQGVDGSEYDATFASPNPGGPLYVMVIAVMADGSTQTSEAVFVNQAPAVGIPHRAPTTTGGSKSNS